MSDETTTATKTVAQEQRVVILYGTRGAQVKKVTTDVTSWGQLRAIAKKEGFDVDKLHCTENVGKHDLVHEEALLPTGPFTVFMRPKETKSGALDRKQLFAAIKEFVGNDKDRKALFVIDGKNMTQIATPKLQELYDTHIAGNTSAPAAPAKETVKAKAAPAKKEKATKPAANVADVVGLVSDEKVAAIGNLLNDIDSLTTDKPEIASRTNEIRRLLGGAPVDTTARTSAVDEAKAQLKAEEEARKAEEEAEKKALAEEAAAMSRGFK